MLEQLFANTTIDIPQMLGHLKQVADSLGLPFGDRHKTYNSRLAQELGLWAESKNHGHSFHKSAFHAYFAEGKNLAEDGVLLEIAEKAGLDSTEAKEVLQKRSFSDQVDADWQLSRQKGVKAVPTFVINNASLTGAQPYNDLLRFITSSSGTLTRKDN